MIGVEMQIDSDEFLLNHFGLEYGDMITAIGSKKVISTDSFKEMILENMKYGSVIVEINRNNITHYVELELE